MYHPATERNLRKERSLDLLIVQIQKNCQNKTSSPKIGEEKMINPNSQTNQTDKREFKGKLNKLKSTNLINESKIDGINLIYMVNTRIS